MAYSIDTKPVLRSPTVERNDMVKAVDKSMEIGGLRVLLKDGGKSGRYEAS